MNELFKELTLISFLIAALVGVIIAEIIWYLIINPLLKRLMRQKCPECYGSAGDWIDGENIWLECEHCNGKGYL